MRRFPEIGGVECESRDKSDQTFEFLRPTLSIHLLRQEDSIKTHKYANI